jgi:hypothetical protein
MRRIITTLNTLGRQDVQEAGNGMEGLERLTCGPVDMIGGITRAFETFGSFSYT